MNTKVVVAAFAWLGMLTLALVNSVARGNSTKHSNGTSVNTNRHRVQSDEGALGNSPSRVAVAGSKLEPSDLQQGRWRRSLISVWFPILSLIVALGSALFTLEGVNATRESFVAVQRAFIIANGVEIENISQGEDPLFSVRLIVENSGATPTRELKYVSAVGHFGAKRTQWLKEIYSGVDLPAHVPVDPEFLYEMITKSGESDGWITRDVVGPKQTIKIGPINSTVSKTNLLCFSGMGLTYTISGVVFYKGVFNASPIHKTKFCFTIYPGQNRHGEFEPRYGRCRHWNCSDDECRQDQDVYYKRVSESFSKHGRPVPSGFRAGHTLLLALIAVFVEIG